MPDDLLTPEATNTYDASSIEVLEGLEAGEVVITSAYTPFKQMEVLSITEES